MQRLEVSGAVRHIYIYVIRRLKVNFFPENRAVYEMEKCGTSRQDTDDNIIWPMRTAYWINKTTHTHSEYVIGVYLLLFHSNGYPNACLVLCNFCITFF
jgi:hypothetical protein